jgi:hypothetical protein
MGLRESMSSLHEQALILKITVQLLLQVRSLRRELVDMPVMIVYIIVFSSGTGIPEFQDSYIFTFTRILYLNSRSD